MAKNEIVKKGAITRRRQNKGNGWEAEEIISKEGVKENRYYYKGKRAGRAAIETKIARQLAGYTLIEKDLRSALSWMKLIEKLYPLAERPSNNAISPDRERFDTIKGLFVAALIFYGKCFTECTGRRIKLDRKTVPDELKEMHDHIMDMRHNFAAHSGEGGPEMVRIALAVPPKKSGGEVMLYTELSQADLLMDHEDEVTFENLIETLRAACQKKREELSKKIYEQIREDGVQFWYDAANFH